MTLVSSLLLAACSGGTGITNGGPSASANLAGPSDDDDSTACSVTFHWLQKDAYANRAGRTTDLWPPHTTTVLDVQCTGEDAVTAVRENHGSKPTDTDASGTPLLVEVKSIGPVFSTSARAHALLTAYQGCECAPATAFLSTDALNQDALVQLIGSLASYVQQNLACTGADVSQVVSWLQSGDFDDVLATLSSCTWSNGDDWGTGFDAATQAAFGDQVDQYHVCNNDAELESALFDSFQNGDDINACDNTSPLCTGPKWFYTP